MLSFYQQTELSLIQRLKLLWFVLKTKSYKPIIKFSNGVEIDLTNNKIILNNPTEILCKENFTITSEKHLLLNSGQDLEERPGYHYSIWLNSPLNTKGQPFRLIEMTNQDGNVVYKEAIYDSNNQLIIPTGYVISNNEEVACYIGEEQDEHIHPNSSGRI